MKKVDLTFTLYIFFMDHLMQFLDRCHLNFIKHNIKLKKLESSPHLKFCDFPLGFAKIPRGHLVVSAYIFRLCYTQFEFDTRKNILV
jgi:hypothetical protein